MQPCFKKQYLVKGYGYYFDDDGYDHSVPSEVMAGIVYEVSEKHGLEVEAVTQQHYLEPTKLLRNERHVKH